MYPLLADSLVIVGAGILVVSLLPTRQLLVQLPRGRTRATWALMAVLTVIFVAGYLGYAVLSWNRHSQLNDLIVPGVFFLGACFVLSSCLISLQAVNDIRRITILEQENTLDPVSGIYNRRYLDRRLEEEIAKAHRYSLPLSILLIDVDQFKQINDTFGHQAGDRVLSCIGKIIQDSIRASDIAARYGGDEMVIITPHLSGPQATRMAERLRNRIECETPLPSNGQLQAVHATVCIGVATCTGGIDCLEKLIQAADDALYRAKAAGRNRVAT